MHKIYLGYGSLNLTNVSIGKMSINIGQYLKSKSKLMFEYLTNGSKSWQSSRNLERLPVICIGSKLAMAVSSLLQEILESQKWRNVHQI